ncbi:MAG: biotin carboxylase N-terminal domain-containing protein [Pseudomonadota bacterium]|nr:biotin carboxylase N-terminal domain-containing protein [Pseudomonadota bacterium]
MFNKLLVANRGEISCRIMRTAQRLGIHCVAIYSDADKVSLHVEQADEAIHVGPAAANESYLNIGRIIDAIHSSGCDAVHPGYGFLSEDPAFASACIEAGAVFIGPAPEQIAIMADKAAARQRMASAGVPVVPGYHGPRQDNATLKRAIAEIGFPVIIKPCAGGGGKGMHVAATLEELDDLLDLSRREASSIFKDDRLIVERYLEDPRHLEVQVFADSIGNTVHLYERDCSLQRRHQKVIEEAPARELHPKLRADMIDAALTVARAIKYQGAGTVEFLLKEGSFYFIEMNTRLQVEHPVTELVTGTDLVEWQLRVASGEPLPAKQNEICCKGHAVQARLYAEDPARNFLPVGGEILYAAFPTPSPSVRIDNGVKVGDHIGIQYDPMIAKIISYGNDAADAWGQLKLALDQTWIAGPRTNRSFLSKLASPKVVNVTVFDTGFIARRQRALSQQRGVDDPDLQCIACWLLFAVAQHHKRREILSSPWNDGEAWRSNLEPKAYFRFLIDGHPARMTAVPINNQQLLFSCNSNEQLVDGDWLSTDRLKITIGEHSYQIVLFVSDEDYQFGIEGNFYTLSIDDGLNTLADAVIASGEVKAPMAGKVIEIRATDGAMVEVGDVLAVMEAMKMEHHLAAPVTGRITSISAQAGELITEGHIVVTVTPSEPLDES